MTNSTELLEIANLNKDSQEYKMQLFMALLREGFIIGRKYVFNPETFVEEIKRDIQNRIVHINIVYSEPVFKLTHSAEIFDKLNGRTYFENMFLFEDDREVFPSGFRDLMITHVFKDSPTVHFHDLSILSGCVPKITVTENQDLAEIRFSLERLDIVRETWDYSRYIQENIEQMFHTVIRNIYINKEKYTKYKDLYLLEMLRYMRREININDNTFDHINNL